MKLNANHLTLPNYVDIGMIYMNNTNDPVIKRCIEVSWTTQSMFIMGKESELATQSYIDCGLKLASLLN